METWIKDEFGNYFTTKTFNNIVYKLGVHPWIYDKRIYFWISLSSGKKRKDLEIYENKEFKSNNGISPLLWAKNLILNSNYNDFIYSYDYHKNKYISLLLTSKTLTYEILYCTLL